MFLQSNYDITLSYLQKPPGSQKERVKFFSEFSCMIENNKVRDLEKEILEISVQCPFPIQAAGTISPIAVFSIQLRNCIYFL